MATYSINLGTPYQTTFLGPLDPNLFLNAIPNNTAQLIKPEDVRDATYTLWENISFKIITVTGSSTEFMGINGDNHLNNYLAGTGSGLKLLLGKPLNSNVAIVDDILLGYNGVDPSYPNSDIIVYNFKADDFNGGGSDQQYTKMQFLAGTSASLFPSAPYLLSSENASASAIDFTIYNDSGMLIIDAPAGIQIGSTSTPITVLQGTGSTGIDTLPGGLPGDVQINLDNCKFGYVTGASGSIGDILILGSNNIPYWGNFGADTVFTLNQVLNAGNTTDGEDIILTTTNDSVYVGGTGSSYARIYHDGTQNLISATSGTIRVEANTLRLEISGIGVNRFLQTDGSGNAVWGTAASATPGGSNTNIQYNSSGSFAGTNLLKWNGNGLDVNNTGTSYSLQVTANANGGMYFDTNAEAIGFVINDGTQDVLDIDSSSSKRMKIDENGVYTLNIGHNLNDLNKISIKNTSTHDGIKLLPYSDNQTFNIIHTSDAGLGTGTSSLISFSPDGANNGLFMGNSIGSYPFKLGLMNSNSVKQGSVTIYGSTISTSSSFVGEVPSVVLGNSTDAITPTGGSTMSGSSRRNVGVNIVPEVDLHLHGVPAVSPKSLESLTLYNSSFYSINNFDTGYITLDGGIGGIVISRIGLNIGETNLTPFGTTIRVWNRCGDTINLSQINEYFGGTYPTSEAPNIYIPAFTGGEGQIEISEGEMMEFVYLQISNANESGGIEDNITSMASSSQLTDEDGVWYLVNTPLKGIRNL